MEQYFKTRTSVDDNPDLARDRRANDARLKSRFEHIFAKYGRDFDGVGDEIDLETGCIIVNNGHIARMQHEVDPGQGTSGQVLRVLGGSRQGDSVNVTRGEELVVEDSAEDMEEDEEELAATGTSGYSGSDNDENESEELPKTWARAPDELSSDFYPIEKATPERVQPVSKLSAQKSAARRQANGQAVGRSNVTSRSKSPGDPALELPLLRESMAAMQALPGQRGSVDPDMIQALGQSIANQLAKFMTGDLKKSRKTSPSQRAAKDTRWEYPMLPGDRIERPPSPSLPESPSAALFAISPNREASVWAPQQQRKRRKSKLRSQVLHTTGVNDDETADGNELIDPLQSDAPSHMATTIGDEAEGILDIDCYNCGATNSRAWRTGPGGRLCDSCGTYYRRYGLLKAVEEPSSTPIPRLGRERPSVPDRNLSTNQEPDVFAIPSTDAPGSAAGYAANTARRVTGDGRNGRFTLEEEECIIRHHEIDHLSWDHIGYLLSLRSAHSVHSHYQKFLKAPGCEARRRLVTSKIRAQPVETERDASEHHASVAEPERTEDTHSHDVFGFIEREDELIVRLREDEGMTWEQIAAYFPDRTSDTLQLRYDEVLAEKEPSSSISDPSINALEMESILRTVNDGPLASMSDQTVRNTPIARQAVNTEFAASGSHDADAPSRDVPSSISHPYAMILNMTDEKAAPFKEMAQLFRDRNEENLVGRYVHLNTRPASFEVNHIAGTSVTSDTANTIIPGIGYGAREWSIKSASNADTRPRLPPPHVRFEQATASGSYRYEDPAISAERDHAQHLHTPSVNARQASVPPRPSEVGPSAWAMTQPVSKGPLPFQPARKGLVPIYPKSSSRGLHDPFISRTTAPEGLTPSHVQNGYSMTRVTRNVSKSHPQSGNAAWSNHAVEIDRQHSVLRDVSSSAVHQAHEVSAPVPRFTSEQDAFIKKAREKRRLAWAEIAATLPGDTQHTASAITHRYYDYLLGKRSATKTPKSQEALTSANDGKPCSEIQSGQVSQYMQQGKSATGMPDAMPVPSSLSAQNHGNESRLKEAHQQLASQQRYPQKALLRRALNNSTKRNSDVAGTGILPEDHVQGSRQSSTRQNTEGVLSSNSSLVSRLHEPRPHSHPEVVISTGEFNGHGDTSSELSKSKTATSARLKAQRQPNHVARISEFDSMDIDLDQSQAQSSGWEEVSSDEYAPSDYDVNIDQPEKRANLLRNSVYGSLVDENEVQDATSGRVHEAERTNGVSSSGTKRKRRRGRSSRVSDIALANSDSDVSCQGEDVLAKPQDTPPAKRGRGRPRKSGLSSNGIFSREVMPEPGRQVVDWSESISPKLRSGLVRTTIGDDVPSVKNNAPHLVFGTWKAPSAVGGSLTVSRESIDRPDVGQDGQELTYQTWGEILVACFRSQPGAKLRCKDISSWVRAHSAHYRDTADPWIHHIYNEVYRNPAFEKADPRERTSGYILIESNLRPGTTEQAGGGSDQEQAETSAHSASAEHTVDNTANKDYAEPELGPASAARTGTYAHTQDESNAGPTPVDFPDQDFIVEANIYPAAEPSHNTIGIRKSVNSDALVNDLPALASPVSRPTSTSASIVGFIDISSDSPIKQESDSENRVSTSQAPHSIKRLLNAQEQSPRAKHMRYSGPAPVKPVSALVTPGSSANSGRLGVHAQSTVPKRFEPLFGAGTRASPATSIGTSGRRVVVATEVARDDGDELDELSRW